MGERECGGKAREEQPQNNKDNSEDDHDSYLSLVEMIGADVPGISV